MGTARLTPSFETHRGSRTRDRPPARQAHRTGWSDGTRCESAAALGRPAPIKKPAAVFAAGFDHGRLRIRGGAFRRGSEAVAHLADAAGGGACVVAGSRVVSAHSLPQGTSAGRNLITLFSSVNNFARSFLRHGGGDARPCARRPAMEIDARQQRGSRSPACIAMKASIGAAFERNGEIFTMHVARHRAHGRGTPAAPSTTHTASRTQTPISRRTSALARKMRELRRRPPRRAGAIRAPETKDPRRRRRGSPHATRRRIQCSSSSSASA